MACSAVKALRDDRDRKNGSRTTEDYAERHPLRPRRSVCENEGSGSSPKPHGAHAAFLPAYFATPKAGFIHNQGRTETAGSGKQSG
jgi:hypothetical protein